MTAVFTATAEQAKLLQDMAFVRVLGRFLQATRYEPQALQGSRFSLSWG